MNGEKIIGFLAKLDEKGKSYFDLAMASFFVEGLFQDEYDLEEDDIDLAEIYQKIPDNFFSTLYPCALEFFFCNEYRDQESYKIWNVVDLFLKKKGIQLSPREKEYYKGLRNSYMGLYEVIDIVPEKSLTLKSMLKHDKEEIIVNEKLATRQLVKWDVLGGRVVHTSKGPVLAGGLLLLSRKSAKEAKKSIDYISSLMLTGGFIEDARLEDPNPELSMKKMWVKEIAGAWFKDNLAKTKPPVLLNMDGDALEYVTLEFPLEISRKEATEILNTLSELIRTESSHWLWPAKVRGKTKKSSEVEHPLFIETQFMNITDGKSYSIYAEIELKNKLMIMKVNSQKRSSILKNFIGLHFNGKLGDAKVQVIPSDSLLNHRSLSKKSRKNEILEKEDEAPILKAFQDQYYQLWLESPIPALENKTPREAIKTIEGKEQVIELIKDMKSFEERKVKRQTKGHAAYNFDGIIRELGIEKGEI